MDTSIILEKIEELRDSAVYKEYENTYEDGWTDAINEILSIIYESTTQVGQTLIQNRYDALFYETHCHGESIYLCDDGSYVCTHGKEPESLYPNDHSEQPK